MVLHIWNNKLSSGALPALCIGLSLLCTSCASLMSDSSAQRDYQSASYNERSIEAGGLAVGLVANLKGSKKLKSYERHLYADQVASHILNANPDLQGNIDSYAYVSARMGDDVFGSMADSYRMEGELSPRALQQVKQVKLRRRFLMLVSILPVNDTLQLPVGVDAVTGKSNPELSDYEDVRFQTARLKAVRVQVYDTAKARKVLDKIYTSGDENRMLATERTGRRYKGNSLLGALANSVSNRVQHASDVEHPPAPSERDTLHYIWQRIGESLPGAFSS